MKIFKALVQDPDLEWKFIDGSVVRAHQHSSGAIGEENQAIGKSVGGNTTKIHMAVDAYGLPIEFDLTGGEVHDSKAAPALIVRLFLADYTIADKGYDLELWLTPNPMILLPAHVVPRFVRGIYR